MVAIGPNAVISTKVENFSAIEAVLNDIVFALNLVGNVYSLKGTTK